MLNLLLLTTVFVLINDVFCGVLIISPEKIELSSLQPFDQVLYENLEKKSRIISFKLNSDKIPDECEDIIDTKYSSYLPTIDYIPDDIFTMQQDGKHTCNDIKKRIHQLDNNKNIIYLIIHTERVKRDLDELLTVNVSSSTTTAPTTSSPTSTPNYSSTTTVEESTPMPTIASTTQETPKILPDKPVFKERQAISPEKPVLYTSAGKSMLYSSQAPKLQINDTYFILGPATIVRIDDRGDYLRLVCSIPVDNGKISLRFKFPTDGGYWSLTSVEVVDTELRVYNLTITSQVTAPRSFSHRCGGETIFTDGSVNLVLYEMQVQPKTEDYRFNDAYNCVPFMTGSIWSGIFVTSILAMGLIVGLSAMCSIKTMDKFDNSKTKQLTITLMGE